MDLLSIGAGAAGVGVTYFLYLAATKGLPAALAWIKAKWNAGKTQATALQSDIDSAHVRITALEQQVAQLLAKPVAPVSAPATASAGIAAVAAALAPAVAPAAPTA